MNHKYVPHVLVLVVGAVLSVYLTARSLPSPQVDDAMYKSPAAELAQHGRFVVPCAEGLIRRTDEIFACYPPVFPLALSGWYRLFGFSLRSSIGFMFFVHVVVALLVTELASRVLDPRANIAPRIQVAVVTAIGLSHLALVTHFDRQEELALAFVLAELLLVSWSASRPLLSGVCIGAAGLTSPFVGLLGVLIVMLRTGVRIYQGATRVSLQAKPMLVFGASVAACVAAWVGYMEIRHPGILNDQMLMQMRHIRDTQTRGTWSEHLSLLVSSIMINSSHVVLVTAALVMLPLALREQGLRRFCSETLAIYFASVLALCAVALLRPKAYTYLVPVQMLLAPCLAAATSRYFGDTPALTPRSATAFGLCIVIGCSLFSYKNVASMCLERQRLSPAESADQAYAELRRIVPPDEWIAVTALHWHAFQGRNPWREAFFVSIADPREIERCRWLILRPGIGYPSMINEFELVGELPASENARHTYAFTVWRRKNIDLASLTAPRPKP